LDHEKEADRILYEDPDKEKGFIILPDLKWDGKQIEDMYLTGICHARNIKSIRDLNTSHLPLLKNMLDKGLVCILIIHYNITIAHRTISSWFCQILPFSFHFFFVEIRSTKKLKSCFDMKTKYLGAFLVYSTFVQYRNIDFLNIS